MDINGCVQTIEIWVDYVLLRLQKMYRRPPVVRRFWNEFCNGCAFYDGQKECLKCVWSWSLNYKPSKTVPLQNRYNICCKIFILHNLALNFYRNSNLLHIEIALCGLWGGTTYEKCVGQKALTGASAPWIWEIALFFFEKPPGGDVAEKPMVKIPHEKYHSFLRMRMKLMVLRFTENY